MALGRNTRVTLVMQPAAPQKCLCLLRIQKLDSGVLQANYQHCCWSTCLYKPRKYTSDQTHNTLCKIVQKVEATVEPLWIVRVKYERTLRSGSIRIILSGVAQCLL